MARVRVTVLGSADAFSSAGRRNSACLIEDREGAVAVDFGPTSLQAMRALDKDPARLDGVLLTHLHGDHFGGLHLFFIDAVYNGRRRRPFLVAGPPGTRRTVTQWVRLAWGRAGRRKPGFALRFREVRPGQTVLLFGRTVRVYPAHHVRAPEVATSLRISTDGRILAFSGDTAWSEALAAAGAGADLFVCECTSLRPLDKHLSWEELKVRLPALGARLVLLTHLSAEVRAKARPDGRRVLLAEYGMVVEV